METVFKKGDKVYCVLYGWGRVLGVDDVGTYPVTVLFDCDEQIDYTVDGKLYDDSFSTLSFTKYTLKGFSQHRQTELPEVGDWCLVTDDLDGEWFLRKFLYYKDGWFNCKAHDKDSFNIEWKYMKRIKLL